MGLEPGGEEGKGIDCWKTRRSQSSRVGLKKGGEVRKPRNCLGPARVGERKEAWLSKAWPRRGKERGGGVKPENKTLVTE